MAKFMKLFYLSEDVELVVRKQYDSDDDTFNVESTFVSDHEGAQIDMKLTGSFKDQKDQARFFEDMTKEKAIDLYNGMVTDQFAGLIPKIETNGKNT